MALLIPWLPDPASEQADRIDFVFWFVTAICIAIFALVAAVIVYSIIHFRARPDDDEDGPPTHGHTGLEIVWTAVPAALVTAISIVSAVVLAKNEHCRRLEPRLPGSAEVDGRRPLQAEGADPQSRSSSASSHSSSRGSSSTPTTATRPPSTLRLPIHTTVQLQLQSLDVIHSFWVPEFSQKQDAVPGLMTKLVITPKRLGTFPVICTELCGLGHALMRSRGDRDDRRQVRRLDEEPDRGGRRGRRRRRPGKALFVSNGCDGCHTFKPAGANGNGRSRPR